MEHDGHETAASEPDEAVSASSVSSYEDEEQHVELDAVVTEHIDTVLGVSCCEKACLSTRAEDVTRFISGYMKIRLPAIQSGDRARYVFWILRGRPKASLDRCPHAIFEMRAGEPGVVHCRKRPSNKPVTHKLLKRDVADDFSAEETARLWASFKKLDPLPPNKEKIHDIYKKVLQYVPPKLRNDPLYIVPNEDDQEEVAATKRARRNKTTAERKPANKKRSAPKTVKPRKKRSAASDK
ncbi:hypothetical protein PHYPSEUDO_000565 [Phytophthora pseudosyringae]|uniref:Uncharacterized protein n=1 Tax=Phytophthora pseudosyringae TaxID=221518 RepID=A0A8T1V3Q8_9STRA|nr:hypothetical protein PHYPSEUDO_000565 [Phytophthora pseudosyringae]